MGKEKKSEGIEERDTPSQQTGPSRDPEFDRSQPKTLEYKKRCLWVVDQRFSDVRVCINHLGVGELINMQIRIQ